MSEILKAGYRVGRHIRTFAELILELWRVSDETRGRIRLRGVYTTLSVGSMKPPPQPGDFWFVLDVAGSDHAAYLQVDVQPRQRLKMAATLENK